MAMAWIVSESSSGFTRRRATTSTSLRTSLPYPVFMSRRYSKKTSAFSRSESGIVVAEIRYAMSFSSVRNKRRRRDENKLGSWTRVMLEANSSPFWANYVYRRSSAIETIANFVNATHDVPRSEQMEHTKGICGLPKDASHGVHGNFVQPTLLHQGRVGFLYQQIRGWNKGSGPDHQMQMLDEGLDAIVLLSKG